MLRIVFVSPVGQEHILGPSGATRALWYIPYLPGWIILPGFFCFFSVLLNSVSPDMLCLFLSQFLSLHRLGVLCFFFFFFSGSPCLCVRSREAHSFRGKNTKNKTGLQVQGAAYHSKQESWGGGGAAHGGAPLRRIWVTHWHERRAPDAVLTGLPWLLPKHIGDASINLEN